MEGYEKLAQLMGNSHTDGNFLIFQKFGHLSAQNILYLQAEIMNLQEILAGLATEDAESEKPERRLFTRDWCALSSAEDGAQWETFLHLRNKLKEYYEVIAQHRMISDIPQPHNSDLKFLQRWLERPNMGNYSFFGADRDVYEINTSGLGTLASQSANVDPLTRFLLYSLPKLYHWAIVNPLYRLFGPWVKKPEGHTSMSNQHEGMTSARSIPSSQNGDSLAPKVERYASTTASTSQKTAQDSFASQSTPEKESFNLESQIFLYRDSYFHHIGNIVGILISSLIPIASIVVLYFITDMPIRLAIVCLFTVIFSIALSLVTAGTRVEIFVATAAFASVQVVFMGSTKPF